MHSPYLSRISFSACVILKFDIWPWKSNMLFHPARWIFSVKFHWNGVTTLGDIAPKNVPERRTDRQNRQTDMKGLYNCLPRLKNIASCIPDTMSDWKHCGCICFGLITHCPSLNKNAYTFHTTFQRRFFQGKFCALISDFTEVCCGSNWKCVTIAYGSGLEPNREAITWTKDNQVHQRNCLTFKQMRTTLSLHCADITTTPYEREISPANVLLLQLVCRHRINSSPPSAAYMCQWIGSAMVQKMAWRRIGAKPVSKSVLAYCMHP